MENTKTETTTVIEINDSEKSVTSAENPSCDIQEHSPNENKVSSEVSSSVNVPKSDNIELKKYLEPVKKENSDQGNNNQPAKKTTTSNCNKRKLDNPHDGDSIEEKKSYQMRKNIRGILDENNIDTTTKTAQREEYERLARVQELKKSLKSKGYFGPIENVNIKADLHSVHGADTPRYLIQNKSYIYQNKHFQRSIDGNKVLSSQWHATRFHTGAVKQTDEVVTIDSSSEDDCIILSDSDDCLEDEIEADDRHNSGSHIRDMLNIPNEQGRVLVNVGHVENEPDIFMAPQIAKIIKPHQIGGVRFLFDNIIESTNRFSSSSGFGCILAHSMGLGKTLQVICFCDIFLRHTNSKSILCVMPINTIQNWVNEFNMWVPQISFNEEEVRPREFNVFALNDQHKTLTSRAKVIRQWQTEGGVLLIGYEMFRVLGLKVAKKKEGKKHTESASHKQMLENMYMALVRPGPDLVICDEGHRIKNAHAGISLALKQIRTRRRIVLTGYPLQNNLLEYWCMVDFVRPNYLGSKAEFCNMFERPIQNGQCIDSTPQDIKLMRYRAHVLHSLLVGFVQRRSDSVLQSSLPQKLEYVLQFKMTKFQRSLYEAFMNEVVRKKKVPNPLKAFAVCCKIWNHPDVLYNFLKKREFEFDLEIDEPDNQETNSKLNTNNLNPKKAGDISTPLPTTYKTPPTTKDKNIRNDLLYGNSSEHPLFYPNSTITSVNESKNCFWGEGGNSVGAQPLTPDYVGVMPKTTTKPNDVDNSQCSTQIVDLDTKEVQFVTSTVNEDLDMYPLSLTNNSGTKNLEAETKGIKIDKLENKTTESIPYDWALNLFKNYEPGMANNSPKMEIFLHIVNSSVKMGDRVLVFSQSLLTLNLIESFLQKSQVPETQTNWKKNSSYCRLDGSTSAIEREKLVNEFNKSEQFKVFLISTRAGSLGINLTGANRVVIFDASWNPCHDTQAVHRIYRFGQKKSCFVYRLIMDNCLEKNIYDRQVKKQGMSDRVVDECNPDAHLSIRELTNLCYDKVEEKKVSVVFTKPIESYTDTVMREIIANYKDVFTKEPFCHESLLVDRKDKKLSQTEKKLAKRAYEMEKKAATRPQILLPANLVPNKINQTYPQPMRKIVKEPFKNTAIKLTRWIPAEVWQRQGMSSQEMKLPIDVSIPTNANDASSIVVKAGEKVMVLKSPKGVYMQLQSGKIIAIKTTADAVQEKITRGKKLETFEDKRILNLEGIKDVRCNLRLERPVAEDDKDDVIIIEDKDTDETAESVINLKEPSPPDPNRKIENVQPRGDQPDVVPFPSTILKNTQNPKELEQRTKFCQPTKPEPPPLMNYLDNQCDQFLDNSMNNLNTYTNQHVQSSNTASTATPSAPSNGWENTSPEMYKQSLKISNIPAPYPSTAVFSTYEKNERTPQPLNNPPSTNVEQFQSTYMHPNNQTSADAYHHNPDLSANYYNNSMLPTPTENVGSLNTYQYNKKENCYSENLYENSNNSHANYHHPQMSKYSYGSYYQPQYLPNYAKGYEECAYPATANSQFYLRRPNTYSPNTSDGVDLGLNYTEAQGWMNKHLSN